MFGLKKTPKAVHFCQGDKSICTIDVPLEQTIFFQVDGTHEQCSKDVVEEFECVHSDLHPSGIHQQPDSSWVATDNCEEGAFAWSQEKGMTSSNEYTHYVVRQLGRDNSRACLCDTALANSGCFYN